MKKIRYWKSHTLLFTDIFASDIVVNDQIGAVFVAVAGEMKLEQSQDRLSQGSGDT